MSESISPAESLGEAVARRISVDKQGNFPITGTLIAVLGYGLGVFNQALFWLLALILGGQGRAVPSGRFMQASLALGALLWLVLVVMQVRVTAGGRRVDLLAIMLTGCLVAAGQVTMSPGCVLAGVGLLVIWNLRGLRRKKTDGE